MKTGMGSHQSHKMIKDEWLTPPWILKALGEFDLDPCHPHPDSAPWFCAPHIYTANGLEKEWFGRVWMNPPYGAETGKWLKKLSDHGNGTALVFARTETEMFFEHVWGKASAILFIQGRLFFHHVSGERAKNNSGAPSCLISYGEEEAQRLKASNIPGQYIYLGGKSV
jgi:hypothetical protein